MAWDAAIGLYYDDARWYDAGTGRFVSQDPTGFDAGYSDLYTYANNSPVVDTDTNGEQDIRRKVRTKLEDYRDHGLTLKNHIVRGDINDIIGDPWIHNSFRTNIEKQIKIQQEIEQQKIGVIDINQFRNQYILDDMYHHYHHHNHGGIGVGHNLGDWQIYVHVYTNGGVDFHISKKVYGW
jgi:RHS repeat-associated protein